LKNKIVSSLLELTNSKKIENDLDSDPIIWLQEIEIARCYEHAKMCERINRLPPYIESLSDQKSLALFEAKARRQQ
jgi:hypothetical protein